MKDFKIDEENTIETGFVIPEKYFDDLFEKVNTKIKNEPKVIPFAYKLKYWILAVAAVFVVAFSVLFFQKNNEITDEKTETIAFEDNLTTDEIAEHLTAQDITEMEVSLQKTTTENQTFINEYL